MQNCFGGFSIEKRLGKNSLKPKINRNVSTDSVATEQ